MMTIFQDPKHDLSRSVIQAIQAHDVDTVTIQMAGLFQHTSQEEGEELSSMDQEGQETPEESNKEEEEEGGRQ
jgi:hypothetical protein